jgi:hypothetical protein
MTLDGTYTAVLDRIEDDLAVLEVSDGDARHELVVDLAALPEDGQHPDAVFAVDIEDGDLHAATYDEAESEKRKDEAQDRFDQLSSRPPREEDH